MFNDIWYNTKRAWSMLNDTALREHGECWMICLREHGECWMICLREHEECWMIQQ